MSTINLAIGNDNNNLSALLAQNPNMAPQLWAKGVEMAEQEHNFFEQFEGTGKTFCIQKRTDLAKGAGETINFRTMEGLYGDGVMGDELVADNTEELVVGGYQLTVDWLRHGVETNARLEGKLALVQELKDGVNVALGEWLGRKKSQQIGMMFRFMGGGDNYMVAAGRNGVDDLRTGDGINMDLITVSAQVLRTAGAAAPRVGTVNKQPLKKFTVVAIGEGLTNMQLSSDYKQAQRDAGVRGDENYIFKGGYSDVNGNMVVPYDPIDHAGAGPIGSPFNPKAVLGQAISTTSTGAAFTVYGGGSTINAVKTNKMYFDFFGGRSYRFQPSLILSVGGTANVLQPNPTRYILIKNKPNASIDPGKVGFYQVDANTGNTLTISGALNATGNTANSFRTAQLGLVDGTQAPWAGQTTNQHPVGSVVMECNARGVPIQDFVVFGANAAKRGYGSVTRGRGMSEFEGGFVRKTYIASVFGQTPNVRSDGRAPGFLVVKAPINYAGLSTPVVS